MANTLKFEEILDVMKKNNPVLLKNWEKRKISGARTILDSSKLRKKVIDEVRFKLKGGVQIAFIGNDNEEKLIKVIGGREKAQKSLDYINKMVNESDRKLSDEDYLATKILTTTLEKYIKNLKIRQIKRNISKKSKVSTVAEMQGTMNTIDESDKTDKEKLKEKKEYLDTMREKYKRELDNLKHKLEGIKIKLNNKSVTTKKGKDGVEITNFNAINNLYEQFQSLTTTLYDYNQAYSFIEEEIDNLKKQKMMLYSYSNQNKVTTNQDKVTSAQNIVPSSQDKDTYFEKKADNKTNTEALSDKKTNINKDTDASSSDKEANSNKDTDEFSKKVDDSLKEKIETKHQDEIDIDIEKIIESKRKKKDKVKPLYDSINGKLAYEGAYYRDKVWMKREALDLEIKYGERRENIFTRFSAIRQLMAILPNRRLKYSAINKIENDEIDLGEIYDINTLGDLRWQSNMYDYKSEDHDYKKEDKDKELDHKKVDVDKMLGEMIKEVDEDEKETSLKKKEDKDKILEEMIKEVDEDERD